MWIFSKKPGFNRSFNKNILYYILYILLYIFLLIYLLTYLSPLNFLFYNTYKEITTLTPQKYKISPIFRDLKFSPRKISTKIKNFEEFLNYSNEKSPRFYRVQKIRQDFLIYEMKISLHLNTFLSKYPKCKQPYISKVLPIISGPKM